jgi:hypothetical protein
MVRMRTRVGVPGEGVLVAAHKEVLRVQPERVVGVGVDEAVAARLWASPLELAHFVHHQRRHSEQKCEPSTSWLPLQVWVWPATATDSMVAVQSAIAVAAFGRKDAGLRCPVDPARRPQNDPFPLAHGLDERSLPRQGIGQARVILGGMLSHGRSLRAV